MVIKKQVGSKPYGMDGFSRWLYLAIRTASVELQQMAYEKGLIPFVPE
ncbi:hypothetical protein [Photobacterium profundum]|nr:hypothetical protein [Photobacterium profundum]